MNRNEHTNSPNRIESFDVKFYNNSMGLLRIFLTPKAEVTPALIR